MEGDRLGATAVINDAEMGSQKWGEGAKIYRDVWSWLGGDDFTVFPSEQGEVPAFVLGTEILGHGLGGGSATEDGRMRLLGGLWRYGGWLAV